MIAIADSLCAAGYTRCSRAGASPELSRLRRILVTFGAQARTRSICLAALPRAELAAGPFWNSLSVVPGGRSICNGLLNVRDMLAALRFKNSLCDSPSRGVCALYGYEHLPVLNRSFIEFG